MANQLIIIILIALVLDLLLGDPEMITHPVVLIGRFINWGEGKLRRFARSNLGERILGSLLALLTIGLTWLIAYALIMLGSSINKWLGMIIEILLLSTTLSIKGLAKAGREIYDQLVKADFEEARERLNWIVGRDTENLGEADIVRATVETVAENTVDGIISPLFYAFIGGAPLAMAYKAVNTLDSMLGYKNEEYRYFGWAAARIDDLANLIPARISGVLFIIAAFCLGKNGFDSTKMILRDARKHPSPNGGYPEAAVAGALQVRLGGVNYYQGEKSFRKYLGDEIRNLEAVDIKDTINLMYITTALFVILGMVFRSL
jgi:adenosylcobinamide-phosphate synthase